MANKSIDQLPAADSVSSSDLLMVETNGGTKKATKAQIAPTVDSSPTSGSSNAVSSGGVYTALEGKVNTTDKTTSITSGATTIPTAGAVYSYTKQVYISSTAPSNNQGNYLWVKPS